MGFRDPDNPDKVRFVPAAEGGGTRSLGEGTTGVDRKRGQHRLVKCVSRLATSGEPALVLRRAARGAHPSPALRSGPAAGPERDQAALTDAPEVAAEEMSEAKDRLRDQARLPLR